MILAALLGPAAGERIPHLGALAVEGIAMIMAVYLAISLVISLFMNLYNRVVALVER